ncbi:MAG: LacI family DNA-binding transcriptional regulator [Leucobacter sp.]
MTDGAHRVTRRVVTQRDVAEAAGVDRATVSRALDPQKRLMISPETVERVLAVAETMGYRTNALARGLRTSRSGIVGLEIPTDIHSAASLFDKPLSVFVTSVEERLSRVGLTLLATFSSPADANGASDRFTRNGVIDGLIRLQSHGAPRALEAGQVPVVTVGLDPATAYDVVVDEGRGIEIAVEHLHRLGHRRIAYIGEPPAMPRGERHLRAYERTVRRIGLGEPNPALIAHYHDRHPASAPKAVETILARGGEPTAILFTDDKAAMGGYGVLRAQRIQVPQQISVIGWRDNDAGLFLLPPLTTVALPMRAAAFAATDLLIARVGGIEDAPAKRVFDPYLIQRDSTGPASS